MSQRRVHYVLSSHWDREWYQPFQDYRYRLVRMLDQVIDATEAGHLRGPFQTDGQTIMLEDYLEVRPQRRATIQRLVCEGKLVTGPWYVLPDLLLVSGESLIRNLRLGRQMARSFGGRPSDAGAALDLFGHNSQMPQIFAGFGIRGAFLWRGTNVVDTPVFLWRGADGTELFCCRFGRNAYCDFAFEVRRAEEQYHPFDPAQAAADLATSLATKARQTPAAMPLILFDGSDHQSWDERYYRVLLEHMNRPELPFHIVHSSLDAYLAEALPLRDQLSVRLEGELREPGRHPKDLDLQWLIPGVLSSRVWIKQANARCQALLCHWAEPMAALAQAALGEPWPQGFLDTAWKWLLQNHPHDSICGCSIDEVHQDMAYRFRQCQQIAQRLTLQATQAIAATAADPEPGNALHVTVFNPLPRPLSQVVDLTLQTPTDWPSFNEFFGYEPKPAFRLFTAEGAEVPYQRLGQAMNRIKYRLRPCAAPEPYRTHDVRVAVALDLPAMGYTTLVVRPGTPGQPTRHPSSPGLATSERSMANEYLDVAIEPNGSLTLTDLRTGHVYQRLLTFEDAADIGDGWFHGPAINDQAWLSSGSSGDVALVHDGPMRTTFRVRVRMRVPAEFQFDRMARSPEPVELLIDSLLTLRRGLPRLEVETTVHNVADDHRLRVLLPTGAPAATYLADSAFDVVERPIALNSDNHTYRELEVETKPQQSWTAVYAQGRGLAIVAAGLMETAVRDLPERPLALTLFRGTRRTRFTDGQPDGQLRGALSFDYWIVPLAAPPERAHLTELGQLLSAGLRDVQLQATDVALHRAPGRSLPAQAGFLQLEGPGVLTSACVVEGALEVRLFNPNAEPASLRLRVAGAALAAPAPTQAVPVDFESNPIGAALPLRDGLLDLVLPPKRILTLRLERFSAPCGGRHATS